MPKHAVEPVEDDQVRQPQIVHLAVTVCTFGGGKFAERDVDAASTEIMVYFERLALEFIAFPFAHEKQ